MVIGTSILVAIVGAIVITLIYAALAGDWALRHLVALGCGVRTRADYRIVGANPAREVAP